jgi:hypothetical protein
MFVVVSGIKRQKRCLDADQFFKRGREGERERGREGERERGREGERERGREGERERGREGERERGAKEIKIIFSSKRFNCNSSFVMLVCSKHAEQNWFWALKISNVEKDNEKCKHDLTFFNKIIAFKYTSL